MILLDTHVLVWLLSGDSKISSSAHSAIHEARQSVRGLAISDFTLFELGLLFHRKRLALSINRDSFFSEVERRFVILPVTVSIALQAFELPTSYPKDPVDRVIGATALIEDIPLLTADREIRKSRTVPTIW